MSLLVFLIVIIVKLLSIVVIVGAILAGAAARRWPHFFIAVISVGIIDELINVSIVDARSFNLYSAGLSIFAAAIWGLVVHFLAGTIRKLRLRQIR